MPAHRAASHPRPGRNRPDGDPQPGPPAGTAPDGHTTLATCTQDQLEAWLADGPTTRTTICGFLLWTSRHGYSRPLTAPVISTYFTARIIGKDQRWVLVRHLAHDEQLHRRRPGRRPAPVRTACGPHQPPHHRARCRPWRHARSEARASPRRDPRSPGRPDPPARRAEEWSCGHHPARGTQVVVPQHLPRAADRPAHPGPASQGDRRPASARTPRVTDGHRIGVSRRRYQSTTWIPSVHWRKLDP